ncbi:Alpha/beta hydrolase fold-1 [Hyaloraphidium curvatum]|nr:Alpha/beta hydrolase fold-1 [Hyaloraphidium curvatum]
MEAIPVVFQASTPGIFLACECYTLGSGAARVGRIPSSGRGTGDGERKVSVFFSHANGVPKETWRPTVNRMLQDLMTRLGLAELARLRHFVSIDVRNEGDSLILNKAANSGLSPFPDVIVWQDLAEDLRQLVQLLAPNDLVLGVGHSLGGGLSCMAQILAQPRRLFSRMYLVEPILYHGGLLGSPLFSDQLGKSALRRKNGWPTRKAWESYVQSRPFYARWAPDALQEYLDVGVVGLDKDGAICWSTGPIKVTERGDPVHVADESRIQSVVLKTEPREEASVFMGSVSETHSFFERLGEIAGIPVTVVSGANSDIVPTPMPGAEGQMLNKDEAIASRLKATWKTLPGGHMLVHEDKDGIVATELVREVLALIQELPSASL